MIWTVVMELKSQVVRGWRLPLFAFPRMIPCPA